jgi:hypothetical protein
MVTNVTQEDVIDYCGTWFKSNCVGLVAMFGDPKYIPNDLDSKDGGEVNGDKGVIDSGLIGTMEEVVLPINKVKAFDELESSSVHLEGTLACLDHTMHEIAKECTQRRFTFCDHATSIMKVVASKNICFTKTNESLHLGTLLHHVDDGFGYLVQSLRDWHKTMFTHTNFCMKRTCE